jgi:hypothetical protein
MPTMRAMNTHVVVRLKIRTYLMLVLEYTAKAIAANTMR